jgi:hypothetical protein
LYKISSLNLGPISTKNDIYKFSRLLWEIILDFNIF